MKPLLTCLKSQIKFLLYLTFLTLFTCASAFAQERKVTGTVTSADDNSPMPGVNIIIKGTTTGTITDGGGNYTINVSGSDAVLVFSFIGYNAQEVTVGNQSTVNVQMTTSATQLGEIVVTSLGIQKEKKALTYAAQSIPSAEVVEAKSLNVANQLSGKVAGLELIKSNAGVGSPSRVVLRGDRSIAGNNQPLYIVDGAPISNSSLGQPTTENGGRAYSDGIQNINPEDIESITVLKGASATALYGTRANNGAIVIVTKKGSARKGLGVEYNGNFSVETPVILTKMQQVYGQGSGGNYFKGSEFDWGAKLNGQMVDNWTLNPLSPTYGQQYPYVAHPNNLKDYFQLATNMTNSLSMNTGSEKIQGYFSFTNVQSRGIIPGNSLARNNFNVRITGNLSKKLTFDSKLTYFHQQVINRVSTGDDFSNPMRAILRLPTNISLDAAKDYEYYSPEGKLLQNYWNPHSNVGENPYWMLHRIPNQDTRDRVLSVVSAKYEFIPGLSLQVRTTYDFIFDNYWTKWYNDTYTIADNGNYTTGNSNNSEMNSDFLLNYTKAFGDFSLNVSAGGNLLTQKNYYINTNNTKLLKPNLFTVSNASNLTSSEGGATKKLNSLYGFATLSYRNYLYLDVTGRNDWSSTLPPDSWSYFYPSVGLTWVLSDMFKSSIPEWLTFAKVRGSFAQVGNDTDPYQLNVTYSFSQGGGAGLINRSNTLVEPNLKPEITTSKEVGADIRFFQNRLGLDITFYRSNSKNQLLSIPLPPASGYTSKFINAGNIQNTGFEGTLNIKPLVGNFKWDIDFNFSHNKNLIVSLAEGLTSYTIRGRSWMTTLKVTEGSEYGDIYTRGFLRNDKGQVLVNGTTGLPLLTPGQTIDMGNYNPDALLGIRNSFTYKAWDLSVLIDGRIGGDVFSFTEANLASDGFSDYTLKGREGFVVPGVIQTTDADGNVISETPNDISVTSEAYWQILGGRNTPVGEVFRYSGTNVRVSEAVLGYTKNIPDFAIRSVRVSVYAQNLFFIVNKAERLDPNLMVGNSNYQGTEGFGMPGTRVIGMNVRLSF